MTPEYPNGTSIQTGDRVRGINEEQCVFADETGIVVGFGSRFVDIEWDSGGTSSVCADYLEKINVQ